MHDKRAAIHLEQLRPEPCDVVKIPPFAGHELRIIASIAPDGLLYLRGPGQRIRPHNAEMFARQSDPNYAEAKYAAEQQTAARIRIRESNIAGSRRASESGRFLTDRT